MKKIEISVRIRKQQPDILAQCANCHYSGSGVICTKIRPAVQKIDALIAKKDRLLHLADIRIARGLEADELVNKALDALQQALQEASTIAPTVMKTMGLFDCQNSVLDYTWRLFDNEGLWPAWISDAELQQWRRP